MIARGPRIASLEIAHYFESNLGYFNDTEPCVTEHLTAIFSIAN